MTNRAGTYRNNLTGDAEYKSFVPNPLPPDPPVEFDEDMVAMLVKANRSIAALDSISTRIPDMDLFVSMYPICSFYAEAGKNVSSFAVVLLSFL